MAVDRPNSSDENAETLPERRTAEWRPPRDDPGNEPPGMSRLESRAAARAAIEKTSQTATETSNEGQPDSSKTPQESPSGRDNIPETDTDGHRDGGDGRGGTDSIGDNDGEGESDPTPLEEPEEAESARSGWDAPEYADHPHRPEHSDIGLSDDRRTHILDGEGAGRGGHRHGTGEPGKTEFPADWDDDTAVRHIVDVARLPNTIVELQPNGRWNVEGERDGVNMTVIVDPDGRIRTAWPKPGGRGVVENPEE